MLCMLSLQWLTAAPLLTLSCMARCRCRVLCMLWRLHGLKGATAWCMEGAGHA